jgi:hypothetical protein
MEKDEDFPLKGNLHLLPSKKCKVSILRQVFWLITSESLCAFPEHNRIPVAKCKGLSVTYSSGAAPDLHRSSLLSCA